MPAVLLVLLTCVACASTDARQPAAAESGAPPASVTLELRVGGAAPVPGTRTTLTFDRVRDDSRCPKGVSCIWEGDAIVVLRLSTGTDDAVAVELHANPRFSQEGSAHGVTVVLESLEPQPEADKPIVGSAYVARVSVAAP